MFLKTVTNDPPKNPFAEVGKKFGNTSLYIREMTPMSPASAKAANLIKNNSYFCRDYQGICTVWLRVKLEKQGAVFGGKDIYFYNFMKGKFANTQMISECTYDEVIDYCKSLAALENSGFSIIPDDPTDTSANIAKNDCPGNSGKLVKCSIFADELPLIECLN